MAIPRERVPEDRARRGGRRAGSGSSRRRTGSRRARSSRRSRRSAMNAPIWSAPLKPSVRRRVGLAEDRDGQDDEHRPEDDRRPLLEGVDRLVAEDAEGALAGTMISRRDPERQAREQDRQGDRAEQAVDPVPADRAEPVQQARARRSTCRTAAAPPGSWASPSFGPIVLSSADEGRADARCRR